MAGQLPFARSVTIQAGGTVPHYLVNEIQDGIVTTATTRRLQWVPVRAQVASFAASPTGAGEGDIELANPGQYLVDINVPAGSLLRAVRVVGSALAGGTLTAVLSRRTYSAASTGQSPVQIGATLTWTGVETETRKEIAASDEVMVMDDDSINPTDTSYRLWLTGSGGITRIHVIKALILALPAVVQP